jgi:hypothetical protein
LQVPAVGLLVRLASRLTLVLPSLLALPCETSVSVRDRLYELPRLRDAMNFVARSFNSQLTLRSISCAMRDNAAAVSLVVRIIICESFVALPNFGLPRFVFIAASHHILCA